MPFFGLYRIVSLAVISLLIEQIDDLLHFKFISGLQTAGQLRYFDDFNLLNALFYWIPASNLVDFICNLKTLRWIIHIIFSQFRVTSSWITPNPRFLSNLMVIMLTAWISLYLTLVRVDLGERTRLSQPGPQIRVCN